MCLMFLGVVKGCSFSSLGRMFSCWCAGLGCEVGLDLTGFLCGVVCGRWCGWVVCSRFGCAVWLLVSPLDLVLLMVHFGLSRRSAGHW